MKAPLGALFLCAMLGLAHTSPARASVIYDYVGNPFTNIVNEPDPAGTYTVADFISGQLEFNSQLAPNIAFAAVTPISFSFTDTRSTITSSDPLGFVDVRLATDGAGAIIAWIIQFATTFSPAGIGGQQSVIQLINVPTSLVDLATLSEVVNFNPTAISADRGATLNNPGTFTLRTTDLPTPGPLLLIASGLIALVWHRRRASPSL